METASKKLTRFSLMSQVKQPDVSQRQIAASLGVSAATVNQMIREAVIEGTIEKEGDNPRRTNYRLTSTGRSQRRQIALDLLLGDLPLYESVSNWLDERVGHLTQQGHHNVAIWGTGPMLEFSLISVLKELHIVGLAPKPGYGFKHFDLDHQHDQIDAFISTTNEIPSGYRRLLREHEIPLVFFT
jgi:DNA-binding MarR family transcriptional regulator